jgi:hypothetical protein
MRRFFNYIGGDITIFRIWTILAVIHMIINFNNDVLAEISLVQFLIASGIVAILKRLQPEDDEEEGDEVAEHESGEEEGKA